MAGVMLSAEDYDSTPHFYPFADFDAPPRRAHCRYDALTISTAGLRGAHPPKSIPSSFLSSTPDPGLTAFAQLGLYRLNASRAMISLFDRSLQHIVAEAVRVASVSGGAVSHPEPVWYNGLTFERASSICEHVVTGPAANQSVPGTTTGLTASDIPVSVVKHLDDDARFCHVKDPGKQFYAGVPIRSPTGINIGVYCIFDDKPRPGGLTTDEIRFIREISRVVMDYLESKRSHEWYRREQRMVRGLGSFVKGQATLWKWTESEDASDHPASFQDLPSMGEGWLNKKLQPARAEVKLQQPDVVQDPEALIADQQSPSPTNHGRGEVSNDAATASSQSFATVPTPATIPAPKLTPTKPQSNPAELLRGTVDSVFSKAANVIRESIEVEGVLFLDASVRSYGGLVGNASWQLPSVPEPRNSSSGLSSSGDESGRSHSRDKPIANSSFCDVLGFSTSHLSSVVGDAAPGEFAGCKERFLQRLLRRYPLGQVWNFEADGTVSDHSTSSDEDDPSNQHQKTPLSSPIEPVHNSNTTPPASPIKKRVTTAARIIEIFPGARSVAVVPLWDTQTGRWFAGGFAWTRTPTRAFTEENELTYLRVFGLTAMAEVARLKTRAADKAKTDILGSISHELRSPLHGLVGAIELLKHTALDSLQDGILRTIEVSGRTLLDTIDHLLDFVKISAIQPSRLGRRSRPMDLRHRSSLSAPTALTLPELPIQLDLLVEEVVESVLAGSTYLTRSETHPSASFTSSPGGKMPLRPTADDRLNDSGSAVQIYLDIDHPAKWSFRMHPGAFRRIVMNLFGNSLKFTKSGFIRVTLRQEGQSNRLGMAGTRRVVFSVSDSGKGMSEDYLRNHLFMPFSQEDQFASGTGLGLSLVRHMTATLGGTIDVSSKVGQGTIITVALPLASAVEEGSDKEEADFWQSIKTLAGRRVRIDGFEREARVRESLGVNEAKQRSQHQLLEGICRDMLQMEVVQKSDGESSSPDFVIHSASDGLSSLDVEATNRTSQCPYILVCEDLASVQKLADVRRGVSHLVYEICSQPIGPRKVARALLAGRVRWENAPSSGTGSSEPTDSASEPTKTIGDTPMRQDNEAPKVDIGLKNLTIQLAQDGQKDVATEAGIPVPTDSRDPTILIKQPLSMPPKPLHAPQASAADLGSKVLPPRRPILIVDDNAINLKIMAAYVSKLKHPYTTAINGLEALEIFTNAPDEYGCLLTDISMPVMDGLESTRRIREFELARGHKPVVVIALTGLSGGDVRQDAFASGVDLFLTRPLALRGLEEALASTGLR